MKTIILLTILLFTQAAFSKVLICKQKLIPVITEYKISGNKMIVKYTAERSLKNFKISDVRGLDGLVINSKATFETLNLKKGQTVSIEVEFTKPEGEAFLVTDIEASINAKSKMQSLAIPVGQLSEKQITERKKNIKSLPNLNKHKPGVSALESETKYHTMKLPE